MVTINMTNSIPGMGRCLDIHYCPTEEDKQWDIESGDENRYLIPMRSIGLIAKNNDYHSATSIYFNGGLVKSLVLPIACDDFIAKLQALETD